MSEGAGRRRRWWWLAGGSIAAVAAVAASAILLLRRPQPEANGGEAERPAILRYEKEGFRYTYHVPTGTESLFELGRDPDCLANLSRERPELTARLRSALEAELGLERLEDLRENFDEEIERLRALGYM